MRADIEMNLRIRAAIEAVAVTGFAGEAAEYRLTGRHNHVGARSDRSQAEKLASHVAGGHEILDRYIAYLQSVSEATVNTVHIWRAIESLAKELLEKKWLSARAARKIIKEAIARRQ